MIAKSQIKAARPNRHGDKLQSRALQTFARLGNTWQDRSWRQKFLSFAALTASPMWRMSGRQTENQRALAPDGHEYARMTAPFFVDQVQFCDDGRPEVVRGFA